MLRCGDRDPLVTARRAKLIEIEHGRNEEGVAVQELNFLDAAARRRTTRAIPVTCQLHLIMARFVVHVLPFSFYHVNQYNRAYRHPPLHQVASSTFRAGGSDEHGLSLGAAWSNQRSQDSLRCIISLQSTYLLLTSPLSYVGTQTVTKHTTRRLDPSSQEDTGGNARGRAFAAPLEYYTPTRQLG